MTIRSLLAIGIGAATLAGCATTAPLPPTEVIRYHLGEPIARGTVAVEPLSGGAPASLEFKTYAAAVQGELLKAGYSVPAQGVTPDFIATVGFTRTSQEGPPRRSPISIGIGGGGFSGGRSGGGVGLGGGVGFPIGGGGSTQLLVAELSVTIKRRADQSPVWEGRAQGVSDIKGADEQAGKLARALFTGFPGQSGRTITVK
ncbi:DUF4136 domain-containing protein [Sphingomonadaceae bacterium OTU29MARTA1]|uniref:DUF4136 domain-containing protein n=1 Tax=Sphingomonas sp. Leaf37 TaxID=2876552 RepID=UPI001E5AFEF2|nr:DUF4136 domain-containing protein [Sphingomonas sp. Leaf37]USU03772.1 DUF4136 domain-containing protein [Sphingomonadaceae bacterium OTU29LAMAA1]USU07523.1 DUF4136 domain-containing protein [Sphingomonadaceae bacterium OTU29MARTA1]USU11015.1 DUF4136 domain-containing protein [Sphingomonadaceae bacterium OTU29THOMA1]